MDRERRQKFFSEPQDFLTNHRVFISTLSLFALGALSFSAANGFARNLVKERAGGKCENCERWIDPQAIVAHQDHTKGEKYHHPENLRMLCPVCELQHHFSHWKKAQEIGLSERNNDSAIMTWLVTLANWSKDDFYDFAFQNSSQLNNFLSKGSNIGKFEVRVGLKDSAGRLG